MLSSCASSVSPSASSAVPSSSSRISACKINDTLIQNNSQCLQDDAACYQLSNGQWCTGERGAVCPAGSVVLPQGMDCPIGKRCFRISESLDCTISWSHYNVPKSCTSRRTSDVLHMSVSLSLRYADRVLRLQEHSNACRARPQQQFLCTLIMPRNTR